MLARHRAAITGYVRYNASDGTSSNAALTYIAGQRRDELLVAAGAPAVEQQLVKLGVPLVRDVSGTDSLSAYKVCLAGMLTAW